MPALSRVRTAYVRIRRAALYRRTLTRTAPLVILRYHAVGEPADVGRYVHPALAVSAARFRDHVRTLKRRFRIVGPDEIAERIESHQQTERRAALITFDDGYIDNYEIATPVLVEEGAVAAFYIATQPLRPGSWLWTCELWRLLPHLPTGEFTLPNDVRFAVPPQGAERQKAGRRLTVLLSALSEQAREPILMDLWRRSGLPRGEGLEGTFVTPAHLRTMRAAGMTIGVHTRSHPQLDLLATGYHDVELGGGREDLEAILGEPVRHLAYPNPGGNGIIGRPVRSAAARCGFQTAVTSVTGPIRRGTDLLRLPRLGIYAGAQEQLLFDRINHLS